MVEKQSEYKRVGKIWELKEQGKIHVISKLILLLLMIVWVLAFFYSAMTWWEIVITLLFYSYGSYLLYAFLEGKKMHFPSTTIGSTKNSILRRSGGIVGILVMLVTLYVLFLK